MGVWKRVDQPWVDSCRSSICSRIAARSSSSSAGLGVADGLVELAALKKDLMVF